MQNAAHSSSDGEALWNYVVDAATRGDLEAHLALFLLQSSLRSNGLGALSAPWSVSLAAVLGVPLPPAPLRRPQDVATLGLRLVLGRELDRTSEFAVDARREIAREPLPPAACLRDDERVLLGIAAGIGCAAPSLSAEVLPILRDRHHQCSLHRACLDTFAEALLAGSPALGADLAVRTYQPYNTDNSTTSGGGPRSVLADSGSPHDSLMIGILPISSWQHSPP